MTQFLQKLGHIGSVCAKSSLFRPSLGHQYIIEMKIWRGDSYNKRGEQQLLEYLDYYHLNKGYMMSFCFNKNKQPGVHTVRIGDREIVEGIV